MADTSNLEQRSIEWRRARLGKLTSSEISVLMKEHKEAMTEEELAEFKVANPKSRVTTKVVPFSDATFTYLNRKVMEHFMPVDSDDTYSKNCVDEYIELHSQESMATRYGSDMESVAREKYAETMGYEVFETGLYPTTNTLASLVALLMVLSDRTKASSKSSVLSRLRSTCNTSCTRLRKS